MGKYYPPVWTHCILLSYQAGETFRNDLERKLACHEVIMNLLFNNGDVEEVIRKVNDSKRVVEELMDQVKDGSS